MTRILSLDDCPQMSDLIGLIIERVAGYNLWAANDSYEAWALLHTLSFDLLIQDTLRPDIDGRDFFRLVRADARLDNVPVLMATAVSRKQNRAALINAGVDGYVTKPFAPQELMAAVQDVLLPPLTNTVLL
jgi:DNA-binding response OmpR family regulator